MSLFQRTERGTLQAKSLDLQILFGEFYEVAETEEEIEWIHEQLESVNDTLSEEREEEL